MNNIINNIEDTAKEIYKESVIIGNDKLQNLTINILTSIKILSSTEIGEQKKDKKTKKRYSYEEVLAITKVQIKLANNLIDIDDAEEEILNIAVFFPVHNLSTYNKRLQSYLKGVGQYGFAMPTNWAKALLEETKNNKEIHKNVLQALSQQQSLYLKKDGANNKKLTRLISETLSSM
jgi:hypothetical protein